MPEPVVAVPVELVAPYVPGGGASRLASLIKQGDVEENPAGSLRQILSASALGRASWPWVASPLNSLGGPVHERHRQHDGASGLGGLKVTQESCGTLLQNISLLWAPAPLRWSPQT